MNKDQIKGGINKAEGNIKKTAGKLLGDRTLEQKGNVQKATGTIQKAVGDLKEAVKEEGC